MDWSEPFALPETVIIDGESGYSINVPLGRQVPHAWLKENEETYKRIVEIRKQLEIVIEDEMWDATKERGSEVDRAYLPRTGPRPASRLPKRPKDTE